MATSTSNRGRPKTFDRDLVIQTALLSYWADGPTNVSINEVCVKSGTSKPSVYREFGSDDGLKTAVLDAYAEMVLSPLYEILDRDNPFADSIEELITFITQERSTLGIPDGCLHVAMRVQRNEFEDLTRNKIDDLRERTLTQYIKWIERAKSKREIKSDVATETIALYFDAQNISAMNLQKEGVDNKVITEVLRTAYSAFY